MYIWLRTRATMQMTYLIHIRSISVSSTTSSNEDVILTSDYFNDVTINLRSASIPALSNVSFNPNPVFKLKDEPVQLTFDIPRGGG